MKSCLIVAAILLSSATSAAAQSPATYDVVLADRNLMIPTRDGKSMATDIYRPARNGVAVSERLPVLLQRTPYDKTGARIQAEYLAKRGYVVAVQDIRGRYKSEGKFLKVQPLDATDGFDVIEWLAKQPYSNGSIGMWGTSFAAHMEAGAAILHPPALKTAVINMGGCRTHGTTAFVIAARTRWGASSHGPGASSQPMHQRQRFGNCSSSRKRWRHGTTGSQCGVA